jgi:A/G-specific adenine glycosylase
LPSEPRSKLPTELPTELRNVRKKLLRWYDKEARDLPWRESQDAYGVWVSEIMLQQTRVSAVIPYYERFLKAFPTLESLAKAESDAVMAQWSGLGYYRRARMLHSGVREVMERYGGQVPDDADGLRSLSGIGRYTAGAIASIAFGREEPLVDGNVGRVFARYFGIETPIGRTDTEKQFWTIATELVRGKRPGDLNQSIMELGATVCMPKVTECKTCPLRAGCFAYAEDRVSELPIPKAKTKVKKERWVAVVPVSGRGKERKIWMTRREGKLFGGLWSVPMGVGKTIEDAKSIMQEVGVQARFAGREPKQIEHVLSHRHLYVDVYRAIGAKGKESDAMQSVTEQQLDSRGVAQLTRKIISAGLG